MDADNIRHVSSEVIQHNPAVNERAAAGASPSLTENVYRQQAELEAAQDQYAKRAAAQDKRNQKIELREQELRSLERSLLKDKFIIGVASCCVGLFFGSLLMAYVYRK